MICLFTAYKYLYQREYNYKNLHKDIFIDKYKQWNIIENYKIFLNKIEKLKSYIIEFDKNNIIKPKFYLLNYTIKSHNKQLIIIITYNKYMFFANDKISII